MEEVVERPIAKFVVVLVNGRLRGVKASGLPLL